MVDPKSVLPEQILLTIISLLPFQDAVRTSVLSRDWSQTWRRTRNVEFNERFFSYVGEDEDARRIAFVNFIINWITNPEPTELVKFSITVARPVDFLLLMEDCVNYAVRCGVKVLGLDFSDPSWGDDVLLGNRPGPAFVLPQCLYRHGVLESLTLSSCFFNVADMINFGLLKNLVLGWIELPLQTLNALLVNLPLLESLTLKNCWNSTGLQVVGDNNLRLKSFVVDQIIMFVNPWIEIEAPNLKYFRYSGIMPVFDLNVGELEEAHFEFGLESEGDETMGDLLYQLLNRVHAGTLTVCTYMLQVLPHELESNGVPPMFAVGHLRLKTAMHSCEQAGIRYLLRSCPVLIALTVQIVPERIVAIDGGEWDDVGDIWTRPNAPSFHCLRQTLKVVQVRGYRGTSHEVGFVKYIISRARVLEQLHILIGEELQNQRSFAENRRLVTQTFLGVRKASNNLRRVSVFAR